jgi:hypothetical protein
MAKELAPKAVTETPVATPLAEIARRPDTVNLFGHAHQVMDEFTILARLGYRPHPEVAMQYFPGGMMALLVQLGDPLPLASQRAAESIANEQRKEAVEFEKRVKQEAERLHAAKLQADLDARIAAAETVANAAVEKIRMDAAAERARIEATL